MEKETIRIYLWESRFTIHIPNLHKINLIQIPQTLAESPFKCLDKCTVAKCFLLSNSQTVQAAFTFIHIKEIFGP